MAGFVWVLELLVITLTTNLNPSFPGQALDDVLAFHERIIHTNTHTNTYDTTVIGDHGHYHGHYGR